jgi:hypothetical protein
MPAWLSGRALASHARGQKFESSSGHHIEQRKGRPSYWSPFPLFLSLLFPPNLLKNRVTTAAAVIRCLCVEPAIIVIQNQMLAFVAHDV